MSMEETVGRDERTLAGLAHGSIVLGLFTNGVGGILAALVIWLTQKAKSTYAAGQALQAMVYQTIVFVITMAAWCCSGSGLSSQGLSTAIENAPLPLATPLRIE